MFINKKEFEKYTLLPDFMKDYSKLPDRMKPIEVENKFTEFFNDIDKSTRLWKFHQLSELADRQFYTYETMTPEILKDAKRFIINNIDCESIEIMDYAIYIISHLGLDDLFDQIYSNIDTIKNEEVKNLLIEIKKEYEETISDPYSSYKRRKQ